MSQSDEHFQGNNPPLLDVIDFYTALFDDTDMVAVLRGHLYVEAVLTEIIATKYTAAAPLVKWLDFWRKVRVARDEGLIESQDAAALQALGAVRDSFAHLPLKMDITSDDDDKIHKTMKGAMLNRYETYSNIMISTEHEKPGRKVRAAIAALYDVMTVRYIRALPTL